MANPTLLVATLLDNISQILSSSEKHYVVFFFGGNFDFREAEKKTMLKKCYYNFSTVLFYQNMLKYGLETLKMA